MTTSLKRNAVLKRYHLRRKASIFAGLSVIFGLTDNPYKEAVEKISNTSIKESLQKDWQSIQGDFSNATGKIKLSNAQEQE